LSRAPALTGDAKTPSIPYVQNPLVRALAREKADSRNTHPDVLAQVDRTNEGNKRNLVTAKVDTISMRRKRQRDVGRQEAMEYFDSKETNKELTDDFLILLLLFLSLYVNLRFLIITKSSSVVLGLNS
jgi:hypothetical protein